MDEGVALHPHDQQKQNKSRPAACVGWGGGGQDELQVTILLAKFNGELWRSVEIIMLVILRIKIGVKTA